MIARLENPYQNGRGQWIRGSFHGHCSEHSACASVPLEEGVKLYWEVGAGFVALTDHDMVTDLSEVQTCYESLVFLHGFEYSTRENVIFVGPEIGPLYQRPLEEALAAAGELLTVVCHPQPNGSAREYWTLDKLAALGVWPDGVEVYNGHYGIERALAMGRWPLYADFWDELLTAGNRIWGFANDDFHDCEDFDNAFNMVLVEEKTPQAVIAAAKRGCCYASTGLLLQSVEEEHGRIRVEVDVPCKGAFIGPGGERLAAAESTVFEYTVGEEAYVRFEGEGATGRIFLQPMFRSV